MTESWKSLKGVVECGDNYEVSSLGRVRSVDGFVKNKNGMRKLDGKILNQWVDDDGYRLVTLHYDGDKKGYRVHRLVALSFIPNPNNKSQVNHEDGNKENNSVNNLKWVTSKENIQHAVSTGLREGVKGEDNVNAKLTDEKVIEIFNKYKTNKYSLQELADEYDSSPTVLSTIVSGKAWTHLNLGTHKRNMSTKSIISDELIVKVKELHKQGLSKRKIEKEVGVSRTTVTKILDNY